MGDRTGIEWTDTTWNPTLGCSRVSEGCRHCYAEVQAARIVRMGKGKPTAYDDLVKVVNGEPRWTGKVVLAPDRLDAPLRWRKPRRVFVNSMSDLFHERLTNEQIAAVFGVMAAAPQHTFQILTKRARRMREWFEWIAGKRAGEGAWRRAVTCWEATCAASPAPLASSVWNATFWEHAHKLRWPLPNVWIGTSVENQEAADERIPDLLATPAAVRFLSCEPLLSDLYLVPYLNGIATRGVIAADGSLHERPHPPLDWVIAGCESGPGARPAKVDWYRSLRDQCAAAGVPYFLKQAVADEPVVCDQGCRQNVRVHILGRGRAAYSCGCTVEGGEDGAAPEIGAGDGSHRKPGGVIGAPYLDGVRHLAFPEVRS